MIDLNLLSAAAEMRQMLKTANGGRRCAVRALPSGHHLTLIRLPDRSFPTVFHYRLEVALHHLPPFPEFLTAAADAFGAAGGQWTVRGGWTNEDVRLWTAWRDWFEDEAQEGGVSCDRNPPDAAPSSAGQVRSCDPQMEEGAHAD